MASKHIKYDLKTGPSKPFYEITRSYYSLIKEKEIDSMIL